MEAIGEDRADTAAGTGVSGFSAAALIRGPGLRSVLAIGSVSSAPILSDAPIKDTSDGVAAAGFAAPGSATPGPVSADLAATELASRAPATPDLKAALALLDTAITTAPDELAGANFLQAADFAELTEELSRRVEYLQLQAAAAVERTRTEAITAAETASRAAGWTTGWGKPPEAAAAPHAQLSRAAVDAPAKTPAAASITAQSVPVRAATTWSPADDGSRNTAEFLRTRLRISSSEARRRLALADATLPRTGLAGRP
ncbi:HNH endonuclease signature motif containing protein, partial [Arthrobacter sp. SAFR-023]